MSSGRTRRGRDPPVGVDLDDVEHLGAERLGRWSRTEKRTTQREALAAGRNDGRRHVLSPDSAMARKFAIWASRPCRMPPFTTRRRSSSRCRRPLSRPSRPSRGPRSSVHKRSHTWLAAFSSRGAGRLSSSNLASAASRSASSNSSQRLIRSPSIVRMLDYPPLGFKALWRGPMRRRGDDRADDRSADARRRCGCSESGVGSTESRMYAVSSPGANRCNTAVVNVDPVRRRRGQIVPVERGVHPAR